MQTSPKFTDLGREHRQEVTKNRPTKPPQHHPSCVLISTLLQVPCLELLIYTVSVQEQEIYLLAGKGLILVLVDYEMFLYLLFPSFTSVRTIQSQHREQHYKKSSIFALFHFIPLLHPRPNFFHCLWNAAHLPVKPSDQRCFCLMMNTENSAEIWLRNQNQNTVKPGFRIAAATPPAWKAWSGWKWKYCLLEVMARHSEHELGAKPATRLSWEYR